MKIVNSRAFKKFKQEIGQANHFLITILIGLDGVKAGKIKKSDEFDAAWNPKDVKASVDRSRIFALKSSLAWTVDCLDMYLRMCNRKPKLISDTLSSKFDGTGHSVYEKYKVITDEFIINEIDSAIVDLLICWRNRMTHYDANNVLLNRSRVVLEEKLKEEESVVKYHLNPIQMLESFDKKKCPTFKEMAFLIRKTISFVESVDRIILNKIDVMKVLDDTLCFELRGNSNIFDGIFSKKDFKRRQHKVFEFIKSCGFIDLENNSIEEEEYIDQICKMSYKEAKDRISQGTFMKGLNDIAYR